MKYAPIILFVYNRQSHTEQTVESLKKNKYALESDLFIFSDGAKTDNDFKVKEVRDYLKTITGFSSVTITERDKNLGLANSIIDDNPKVMQISGHMFQNSFGENVPETFFLPYTTTLGWSTWKRAWDKIDIQMKSYPLLKKSKEIQFDFNMEGTYPYYEMIKKHIKNKVDSWGIIWYLSVFTNGGFVLHPKTSLVKHFGFDESATHAKDDSNNLYATQVSDKQIKEFPEQIELDKSIQAEYISIFKNKESEMPRKGLFKKIISKLKKIMFSLVQDEEFIRVVNEKIIEQQIKDYLNLVSIGKKSRLYKQAEINNLQGNKKNIVIGENTHIRGSIQIFKQGGRVFIGDYCYIGENTKIWSASNITIQDRVLIAHNVNIHDNISHPLDENIRHKDYKRILGLEDYDVQKIDLRAKKVIIKEDAWIGFNSVILKGVTIGKGAIVGAGSFVTKDVPDWTVVGGNPAKVIKKLK